MIDYDTTEIPGVVVAGLEVVPDDRGRTVEITGSGNSSLIGVNRVRVETVKEGVVKAWRYHAKRTNAIAVVRGMVRMGLVDRRDSDLPSVELFIGEHNPKFVVVPPDVMYGFKGLGPGEAFVVCCDDVVLDGEQDYGLDEFVLSPQECISRFDWYQRVDG